MLWACWLLWSTFRNKSKGDELSYWFIIIYNHTMREKWRKKRMRRLKRKRRQNRKKWSLSELIYILILLSWARLFCLVLVILFAILTEYLGALFFYLFFYRWVVEGLWGGVGVIWSWWGWTCGVFLWTVSLWIKINFAFYD